MSILQALASAFTCRILLHTSSICAEGPLCSMVASQDGKTLCAADSNGYVFLIDTSEIQSQPPSRRCEYQCCCHCAPVPRSAFVTLLEVVWRLSRGCPRVGQKLSNKLPVSPMSCLQSCRGVVQALRRICCGSCPGVVVQFVGRLSGVSLSAGGWESERPTDGTAHRTPRTYFMSAHFGHAKRIIKGMVRNSVKQRQWGGCARPAK